MNVMKVHCEDEVIGGEDSGSCPVAGFVIMGVEPSGSATTDFFKYWGNMLRGWKVDGTDSGSCPVVGFGISGVEPSGCYHRLS